MIERSYIEKILKINGMSPSEPDDIIRSVLLSARYNNDEIDTALMVLREDVENKRIRVEGLHKVFRTNESLGPQEISQLLGVDVDIGSYLQDSPETPRLLNTTFVSVSVLSVLIAVVGVLLFMHMSGVGLFHPSVF